MAQQTNNIGDTNKMVTAVRWLEMELVKLESIIGIYGRIYELTEQAKQMEKEQIIDAILNNQNGLLRRKTIIEAEQYYNETYVEDKTFKKKSQWTKVNKQ